MPGLLAFISRSFCIGISYKIVTSSLSGTVWGSCSCHFGFMLMLNSLQLSRCKRVQLFCAYVDIQSWPTKDILSQYGQWFPANDHISCTLGLCHIWWFCPGSSWSWWPGLGQRWYWQTPSCFELLVCHLLVYIFLTCSFSVLPVHLFVIPVLVKFEHFLHFSSMRGWSIFKLPCIREVELFSKNYFLPSYRVRFSFVFDNAR